MTPPQPPTNRPEDDPDDGNAQQGVGSTDPATDPTRVVPPNQQQSDHGQYGFGGQPPAPGYGWQAPTGYGYQATAGHWPQPGAGYGQQTFPGYGGPSAYGQAGYRQGGYSQPPGYAQFPYGSGGYRQSGGGPSSGQISLWITLGGVIFLGLLGAVLTFTLLMDLSTAVSRASNICDQYGGQISDICKQSLRNHGVKVPITAVTYLVLLILGSLAALGGAVLMLLKKQLGRFLILGGGVVMVLFAIVCAAQYGGTGRVTYDLIAGVLIAIAGGLLIVPQIRLFLGLPPTSGRRPGQFGGGGGLPYGQQYPGYYGQPGPGYPPRQW
ncbi:hypothetical protein [Mycobacterium sp.]|uniref:hypothetical protein n=1 Tax=Mycobacterium sp. TaxID=1785 RepID=UPI003D6B0E0E